MWIVNIALRRPYTFIVMALLILLSTPLVLTKMATDIFPEINIPVISVIWQYSGLSAQEMGARIASTNERSLTTTVNDIEHIESQSLAGTSIIKIFFQPTADIRTAIAQVVAIEQAQVKQLPPGTTPPLITGIDEAEYLMISGGVIPGGSWPCPAKRCPSNRCSTPPSTSCARSWSPSPAPPCRIRMAVNRAWCRSTWTPRRCKRKA